MEGKSENRSNGVLEYFSCGLNALVRKNHALLLAVSRGEFALSGIRNADLHALLYQSLRQQNQTKERSAEGAQPLPESLP